jgi:hypothetical protein
MPYLDSTLASETLVRMVCLARLWLVTGTVGNESELLRGIALWQKQLLEEFSQNPCY